MDSGDYKNAVTEMYVAMQKVFEANEVLRLAAERVWSWDAPHPPSPIEEPPSPIAEAPSLLLPPSPPSEHEEDDTPLAAQCGDCKNPRNSSLGNCALCEKTLTCCSVSPWRPYYCFLCERRELDEIKSVMDDYPEDAKEAVKNSMYGQGAFDALYLRIQANNCREAAHDTDDAQETRDSLKEAERLDAVATKLLYTNADYTFRPWWYERWDYWRQPGSTHEVPAWAEPVAEPVAEPEEEAAEVACECSHDDAKACVHECSICLKALTLRDSEGLCWLCEDYLETVPKDYPDETAEATTHGAVYALILRIQANNCREAAHDTHPHVVAEEKRDCLRDAKRLDARASALLYESSGSFKPWWFNRWDYWMQPGSTHLVPAWAEPVPVTAECTVCLNPLMTHEDKGTCTMCKDELKTVPIDYPNQSAEATANGAFHALVLRVRADKFRYHAHSSKSAAEKAEFLADAERIDARASELLHRNAASSFKPWWHTRWDYWCKPGSMHMAPAWAGSLKAPVAAPPCWGCTIVNGSHVGTCWSEALATGPEAPSIERLPCGIQYAAAAPEVKAKPNYKHPLWPSPRPKLFAKALGYKIKKHEDALKYLAQRAKITLEELLKMDPETYAEKHMGGKRNAPYNCNRPRGWP